MDKVSFIEDLLFKTMAISESLFSSSKLMTFVTIVEIKISSRVFLVYLYGAKKRSY